MDLRGDPGLAKRHNAPEAPWDDLVSEVNAWSGDALITHEFFCAATSAQVGAAVEQFGGTPVEVIITARAMVDLAISRWQEWVRNGGAKPIDDYPPRERYDPTDEWGWGSFDLADVLERWGSVIPHDRIHVLPMDRGADPADIWRRFAGLIGVDPGIHGEIADRANRSMGVVETELLRRVNPSLKEFKSAHDRGKWIRGYLAKPDILAPTGERFRPGEEKLADLERRGARAHEMLTADGYDVVGDLEALAPSDVSGYRHPSEVSDQELVDAAAGVIAALLARVREADSDRGTSRFRLGRIADRVTVLRFLRTRRRRSGAR